MKSFDEITDSAIRQYASSPIAMRVFGNLLGSFDEQTLEQGYDLLLTRNVCPPVIVRQDKASFRASATVRRSQSFAQACFAKLPKARLEKLERYFEERPEAAAAVRSHRMDPSVLDDLAAAGADVAVLGKGNGHDYMEHRCSQVAFPCTHAAALFLLLAHAVGAYPMLIFILRGVDIGKVFGAKALDDFEPFFPPQSEPLHRRRKPQPAVASSWSLRFLGPLLAGQSENTVSRAKSDVTAKRFANVVLDKATGTLTATAALSYAKHDLRLKLRTLDEDERKRVDGIFALHSEYLADLASKKMPKGLEKDLEDAGVRLEFDLRRDVLSSKDEYPQRDRHLFALALMLALMMDADPSLYLGARGYPIDSMLGHAAIAPAKESAARPGSAALSAGEILSLGRELDRPPEEDASVADLLASLSALTSSAIPEGLDKALLLLLPEDLPRLKQPKSARDYIADAFKKSRVVASYLQRQRCAIRSLGDFSKHAITVLPSGSLEFASGGTFDTKAVLNKGDDGYDRLFNWMYNCGEFDQYDEWGDKIEDADPGKPPIETEFAFAPMDLVDMQYGKADYRTGPSGIFAGRIGERLLERSPAQTRAMLLLWQFSLRLVQSGAVMPLPFKIGRRTACRWVPNIMPRQMEELTARIGAISRALLAGSAVVLKGDAGGISCLGFGLAILGVFISDIMAKAARGVLHFGECLTSELSARYSGLLEIFCMARDGKKQEIAQNEADMASYLSPLLIRWARLIPVVILEDPRGGERSAQAVEDALRQAGRDALSLSVDPALDDAKPGEPSGDRDGRPCAALLRSGFIDRKTGRYIKSPEGWEKSASALASECRLGFTRLCAMLPDLKPVAAGQAEFAKMSEQSLEEALKSALPALELAGARILIPKSMRHMLADGPTTAIRRVIG